MKYFLSFSVLFHTQGISRDQHSAAESWYLAGVDDFNSETESVYLEQELITWVENKKSVSIQKLSSKIYHFYRRFAMFKILNFQQRNVLLALAIANGIQNNVKISADSFFAQNLVLNIRIKFNLTT